MCVVILFSSQDNRNNNQFKAGLCVNNAHWTWATNFLKNVISHVVWSNQGATNKLIFWGFVNGESNQVPSLILVILPIFSSSYSCSHPLDGAEKSKHKVHHPTDNKTDNYLKHLDKLIRYTSILDVIVQTV